MKTETALFGGGCFWCTEAIFKSLRGVVSAVPGYAGGTAEHPTYQEVSRGTTGHVEVVKIEFDPSLVSFGDLLAVFFHTHDPTTLNRQGSDVGPQYRSVIFYTDETQRLQADELVRELDEMKAYDHPIITEILPAPKFFEAESYHRDYYEHHRNEGYCQLVIAPKLEKLNARFSRLIDSGQA